MTETRFTQSTAADQNAPWHARLFAFGWDTLGFEPATSILPLTYLFTLTFAAAYLLVTAAIWIVLNAGTLLFGVYVEPVWRIESRFRVLYLPGRIPVIAIAMPVLLIFAIVHSWVVFGPAIAIAPIAATLGMAASLLGALVTINYLNRKGR